MIASLRSRALERFWEKNGARRLHADHVPRIRQVLRLLETSTAANDLDVAGLHFHPLTGI